MKKHKKNNLDEMQEQTLLKIEHTALWLGFWALTLAIVIQGLMGGYLDHILGEVAVLLLVCGYLLYGCLKQGIWDRRLTPSFRNNLLCSLAAGVFIGIFFWVRLRKWFSFPGTALLYSLIAAVLTFALAMAVSCLCAAIYKKRRKKLDEE